MTWAAAAPPRRTPATVAPTLARMPSRPFISSCVPHLLPRVRRPRSSRRLQSTPAPEPASATRIGPAMPQFARPCSRNRSIAARWRWSRVDATRHRSPGRRAGRQHSRQRGVRAAAAGERARRADAGAAGAKRRPNQLPPAGPLGARAVGPLGPSPGRLVADFAQPPGPRGTNRCRPARASPAPTRCRPRTPPRPAPSSARHPSSSPRRSRFRRSCYVTRNRTGSCPPPPSAVACPPGFRAELS